MADSTLDKASPDMTLLNTEGQDDFGNIWVAFSLPPPAGSYWVWVWVMLDTLNSTVSTDCYS